MILLAGNVEFDLDRGGQFVRAKFEGRSFIRLRNIGTFRCGALIDPVTLTFDLLILKSVWESHVTWGTPVQSFVFLGLLVFKLEPIYATSDRRTDVRRSPFNAPAPPTGRGHNKRQDCDVGNRSPISASN